MSGKTFKNIPIGQQELILEVLAAFPELEHTTIRFVLKARHPIPYGTVPVFPTWLYPPEKRIYCISILDKAKPPLEQVLFKNLSKALQRSVIAHELSHVVQFQSFSSLKLLRIMLTYSLPPVKRKMERGADTGAITHGYGEELLAYALYVRLIPDYIKQHQSVVRNYLHPEEIRSRLQNLPHP